MLRRNVEGEDRGERLRPVVVRLPRAAEYEIDVHRANPARVRERDRHLDRPRCVKPPEPCEHFGHHRLRAERDPGDPGCQPRYRTAPTMRPRGCTRRSLRHRLSVAARRGSPRAARDPGATGCLPRRRRSLHPGVPLRATARRRLGDAGVRVGRHQVIAVGPRCERAVVATLTQNGTCT